MSASSPSLSNGVFQLGRRSPFKQHDVTRALRGAIAAGVAINQIKIDNAGNIVLITSSGAVKTLDDELDEELAEFVALQNARLKRP